MLIINMILEEEEIVLNLLRGGDLDRRRLWARDWVLRRPLHGPEIYQEVAIEDEEKFVNAFRMKKNTFDKVLGKILSNILKKDTVMRLAIPPDVRLKATLPFLATGASFGILEDFFRITKATLSRLIPEVCEAIWMRLHEFVAVPQSSDEWKSVMDGFEEHWQYPGCIGALDGKHIVVQKPPCTGSLFYNYKGSFSFVLLAIVDSNYKFLFFNVGTPGSTNDAAIWNKSVFKRKTENKELFIPESTTLTNGEVIKPHLVGDDIFGLETTLMKPYPVRASSKQLCPSETMFNYRLSRARRVVENAFGILTKRWQVLAKPMTLNVSTAMTVVQATIALHNFLLANFDCNHESVNEANTASQLTGKLEKGSTKAARDQRDLLKDFFMSPEGSRNSIFSWKKCLNKPCPYNYD